MIGVPQSKACFLHRFWSFKKNIVMKKIFLSVLAVLFCILAGAQSSKLDGALDPLKDASLLDVEINFDDGAYKYIPEEQFAKENSDWEQIKKETSERFMEGINAKLRLTKRAAVMTDKQDFTIQVDIVSVDEKGNTISNVRFLDEKGNAFAKIDNLYASGGRFGTFCNLMGDGMEETGEKIGRTVSYYFLKKKIKL